MVEPLKYAAALRQLKRMLGCIYHPGQHLVLKGDRERWNKIHDACDLLAKMCDLSTKDVVQFRREGVKKVQVKWSDEKRRYLFSYVDETI